MVSTMESKPVTGARKGMRYWGPALITVGVAAAIVGSWIFRDMALYWFLAICSALVLAGITLVAASRLEGGPSTRKTDHP
jgi:hypothetical protein